MTRVLPARVLPACLLAAAMLSASPLAAAQAPLSFDSPEQEARFRSLTEELRCAVCQNQSLADSDAQLAQDLRREISLMIREGHSDAEIKAFLVERYGDFVLYRPPVQGNTLLLWLAPVLLLAGGAVLVGVNVNRRRALLREEERRPRDGDS